jgi:ketosteroid isomerase-like protein
VSGVRSARTGSVSAAGEARRRGPPAAVAGLRRRAPALGGLLLAAALALTGCRIERTENPTGRETGRTALALQIRRVLDASAAGWNAGDLGAFMDAYLESPTTTYWGRQGLVRGYVAIRHHYAPRFAPGAERDSLRFDQIEARRLGAEYALATSRWVLFRGDSVTATGPFSLVLERVAGAWKIIHDHSSTFAPPAAGSTSS